MSEDDRDIDIESNAENDSDSRAHYRNDRGGFAYYIKTEAQKKKDHHNELERKRRDHIKDGFTNLREAVPTLQGERVASRALILKKAAEYIEVMSRNNDPPQASIEDLRRQNSLLEAQIHALEKINETGNFKDAHEPGLGIHPEGNAHDTDSSDGESTKHRAKKHKIYRDTDNSDGESTKRQAKKHKIYRDTDNSDGESTKRQAKKHKIQRDTDSTYGESTKRRTKKHRINRDTDILDGKSTKRRTKKHKINRVNTSSIAP